MKTSATNPDTIEIPLRRLLAIATHERGLMICVFGVVILNTLSFYVSSMIQAGPQRPAELLTYTVPFVGFFLLVSLAATWIATLALLSKVNERMDFMTGLLVAVLMLTPLLHIVFLPSPIAFIWAIDRAARIKLKANGVMVGMMGADLGTLRKRLAEQELDEEDITPPLAEQPS